MKRSNILEVAVLFVLGIFMIIKLGRIAKIIGALFVAAGVVWLIFILKENGIIKERTKKSDENEIDERDAEIIKHAEEMEALEEFDADSGKGYCPHCGNYAVNSEKICESCGEKVNE